MDDLAVAEQPTIKVAIVYNPLKLSSLEHKELVYNPDFTLADYLVGLPEETGWVVGHNGVSYEKDQWQDVRIPAGQGFSLVCVPEGGGGAKGIFRIVALLAIVVASFYVGPEIAAAYFAGSATAASIAGATFALAGSMLVNAVLPAGGQGNDLNSQVANQSPTTYGYDGAKNTSAEGIVVPVIYGTFRVGGNIVDMFTQNIGDSQYLFMRTVLNDGLVESISDYLINNEPFADFSDIEVRVSNGDDDGAANDWFGQSVRQVAQSFKLNTAYLDYTTTTAVEQIGLSIIFPQGLFAIDTTTGKYLQQSVTLQVQCSPHGLNQWGSLGATPVQQFLQYTGGMSNISGYGGGQVDRHDAGPYAVSYGNIMNPESGSFFQQQMFTGSQGQLTDVDTAQGPNPLTGANEYTVLATVSSVTSVTVEALAEILMTDGRALDGAWGMNAVYRAVGDSNWTSFGNDQGEVLRDAGASNSNAFPMVYRTWTVQLPDTGSYEIAVWGGTIMEVQGQLVNSGDTDTFTVTKSQNSTVRYDFTGGVLPLGIYDVRISRTTPESVESNIADQVWLEQVSEIIIDNVNYVGTANLSLKITMDNQLSSPPGFTALVQGCLVNIFDADGNITSNAWSANPAWCSLDILMNENRGRGLASSNIDFPAFKAWADYCDANNIVFNMVYDSDSTVFDAVCIACRCGNAALVRVGTKWSVTIDQPSEAVQLFNESNIIKGTFKIDWLALTDRANEIEYTYFDETNYYQQTTIRVTDPSAPNVASGLRTAQVTGYGVTNFDQANAAVQMQIRENALLTKTVTFDAPLESISLTQGDVAIVQHTSANYGRGIGGGRLKPGSTTTVLNLDCPVTMTEGTTYTALVVHPALKKYDVTIVSTAPGVVYATGLPSTVDRVNRLIQGSVDTNIVNIVDGNPSDLIYVDNVIDLVPGAAELWATDVVEEATVVYVPDPLSQITLTAPLAAVPPDYSIWMVGPVATVQEKYRLRSISGQSILQRTLVMLEYNDNIYTPLGITVTPPVVPPLASVAQAQNLFYSYPETFVGNTAPITVSFNWTPGDTSKYGGADIYLSLNNGPLNYLQSLQNVTAWQTQMNPGDEFRFKVIEYDMNSQRANPSNAPLVGGIVTLTALALAPPTNLVIDLQDFLVQATVFVGWTASTSTPIDGYLVEYVNITEDQYNQFNAGTWLPDDSLLWNTAGLAPGLTETIVQDGIGWLAVRVRTQFGQSVSDWVTGAFFLNAPTVPGRVTGLQLNNTYGDPNLGQFMGKDAKFQWRDVAALATSLADTGADVNGMDYTWRDYQVVMKSPAGQILRTEYTTNPYYTYTFEMNVDDSAQIFGTATGEAHRSFTIEVRLRGKQGQLSDPAWMDATNPAPDVIAGTLIAEPGGFCQLDIVPPGDPDFAGMLVYASTAPNTPPSEATEVWIGGGVPIWNSTPDTLFYVKWAGYDVFGQDELNFSPEVQFTPDGISAEALGAELLDKINLITADYLTPGSVAAQVYAESQARVDADSAEQDQINNLVTQANNNDAAIIDESTARTDADTALSDRITAVVATANGNTSAIATEATARSDGDSALSTLITTLNSTVGAAQAAITTEQTARAGGDAALSSDITALTSTVNGQTTTITNYGTSINGLLGKAGVNIDANGHVVGWELNNNGSSGQFIVTADFFGVAPAGVVTTVYPFSVSGGVVSINDALIQNLDAGKVTFGTMSGDRITVNTLNGNTIIAGSITSTSLNVGIINAQSLILDNVIYTGHLQSNTVTNSLVAHGGITPIASLSWTTLATINITTTGGNILISFTDYVTWNTNGPRGFYRLVREDGTVSTQVGFGGGSCPDALLIAGSGLDTTSAAGNHAYSLQAEYIAGNQPTSQGCYLIATELKK